ncbi:uncharacterized protein LOC126836684 isoform X2 [Adelges cooleyi]|uniref:uncharacterized protein LOC126836684 isoform X2 n=1 Tax=Adelges cooleyi TaxID=133065 RepID=UPI0021805C33|nr:uncharacterized protein LOC126836684 isoform X2 [Adelges cooleyi]
MIVKMNALMLICSFAITLNIKTIESAGNQIVPVRFYTRTSSEDYVQTVNDLKTFNKRPTYIKPAEQINLSTHACDNINDYHLKLKSRDKLEKRAQDIKCSFCVITKSNISNMKNLVENLKSGEPFGNNEDYVNRLEEEAKIILHLLLMSDLETGKWLWIYYLKMFAISQYEYNKHLINENPFEDDQLQSGVSDFIDNCIAEKYLPKNTIESDLVSKKPEVYKNMFRKLRVSGWVSNVLGGRVLVFVKFLYLKPFWEDENQLLFRQITEANVDWSYAKQRFGLEVAISREFVENRTWMYKPYGRLDHQHLLIAILDARFYCHLSVVLYIYEKQISMRALDELTLKSIKNRIVNVIKHVLGVTAYKDEFLVVISSEFKFAKISDIDDIRDILARVRAKANEILKDLNGASTIEVDFLGFNINENQLSSSDSILRIIKNFKDYLNELTFFCLPSEYRVLLHFVDVIRSSASQYI